MKCPACGDEEHQRRIGRIGGGQNAAYHCETCDQLYAALDEPEEGGDRDGEEE